MPGVPELVGGHLGDLAQPVRPLGPIVAQREPPFVERDQLLVVGARLGQRLQHVERPLAGLWPIGQGRAAPPGRPA